MAMQSDYPRPPGDGTASFESGDPRGKAHELADQAQEKAHEMAGQARESAQATAGQVQTRMREQLDQRSAQAAEQVNSQASDLRAVSRSLREQGHDGPAQAAERLAQYAERIGGYLEGKDSDALLSDAEEFARRQPWAVAAGGLVLGFAASRFLKASGRKRYSSRSQGPGSASVPQRSDVPAAAAPGVPAGPPVAPTVAGDFGASGPDVSPPPPARLADDAPSVPAASPIPGAESWRR
jgi:hypothetical protein